MNSSPTPTQPRGIGKIIALVCAGTSLTCGFLALGLALWFWLSHGAAHVYTASLFATSFFFVSAAVVLLALGGAALLVLLINHQLLAPLNALQPVLSAMFERITGKPMPLETGATLPTLVARLESLRDTVSSSIGSQMRQKRLHLHRSQLARMTLAKMQDKSSNPIDIRLLGANAVVFEADFPAHLIEQANAFGLCLLVCHCRRH